LPERIGISSAARRSCLPLTLAPIPAVATGCQREQNGVGCCAPRREVLELVALVTAAKSAAEVRIVSAKHPAAAAPLTSLGR
jgi:hypothetical protein